jgi:uncharacterized repeat protein (TIGR01451 family)
MRRIAIAFALVGCFVFGTAVGANVQLTRVATGFNNPIGIDHHPFSGKLILSVNFPTGQPYNFELVGPDGGHAPFSGISGLTEEVKIAAVREGPCQGGFTAGEVFTGTGVPGVIARIAPNGGSVINPWVTLPGETGLLRGSLFQDRYCAFGGDLLVVTTAGNAWRVTSAGVATQLASLGTHLEGLTTVPNDAAKYGPWAGRALAGAEDQGRIYAIGADGSVNFYELGPRPEDIDIIPTHENFYGVDFGGSTIWGAAPDQFSDKVGDILMSQEFPGILWHVRWNGLSFEATEVARVTQWEHITFSPAGVPPIPPATPCSRPTINIPADSSESGLGWSLGYFVSANDGLVVHDVKLATRFMAQQMSVPYYFLETSALQRQRAELKPNGDDASARSRLIEFERLFSAEKIMLKATYAVDRIPAGSESCLIVEQLYEFAAEQPNGGCEASQTSPIPWKLEPLPCNKWKPQVKYTFTGSNGETLKSINMPLRLHFKDENKNGNFAATFQDNDSLINAQASIVRRKEEIQTEKLFTAIKDGGTAGDWDNYHQTWRSDVRGPTTIPSGPGCPECVHIHWRWSALAGALFGGHCELGQPDCTPGDPLIPKGSTQGVEFAAVLWHLGEEDPPEFTSLINSEDLQNKEMVFWYSPTGTQASDTFFQHGGFFSTLSLFSDLAVTGSASPDPVTVGNDLTYTFTITNNGPAKATGVKLSDIWSLGGVAQFVAAESSDNCQFDNGRGQVICTLGNMQSGTSRTVTVTVRTFIPTAITNIAFVESKEADQEPDNNEVRLQTVIQP